MRERDLDFIDRHHEMKARVMGLQSKGVRFVKGGYRDKPWERICIGPDVEISPRAIIWPDVILLGNTKIGENCEIESGVRVEDSDIGDFSKIKQNCEITRSQFGKNCTVNPFCYIADSSAGAGCLIWARVSLYHVELKNKVKVHSDSRLVWIIAGYRTTFKSGCVAEYAKIAGRCTIGHAAIIEGENLGEELLTKGKRSINICHSCNIGPQAYIHERVTIKSGAVIARCEIVRSTIGENTIVKHHAYIGDAKIGRDVNIGAGTVIANYDGKEKYELIIEDGVFIGSNCTIISKSVKRIGKESFVPAHVLLTEEVSPHAVPVREIGQQKSIRWSKRTPEGWDLLQMLTSLDPNNPSAVSE